MAIALIVAVVVILMLLMCGGLLLALLLPAVQAARAAAQRAQSASNLRQIVIALNAYESVHGHFPPAYVADEDGKKLYSWRVLILPQLDQQRLFDQFDKESAWDSPENRGLADQMPVVFRSPQEPDTGATNETSYLLMAGQGTIFADGKGPKTSEMEGASQKIAVVEVHNSGVVWTEPTDLDAAQLDFLIHSIQEERKGQITTATQGVNVGHVDASIEFLPKETPPQAIRSRVFTE
jgi:hypothetical protein